VQRTLDPLGLVLKGGAWYLVARRSAGMRVYRVSRFAAVRIREDAFVRPEGFELAEYWEEWSRNFEASLHRVEIRVRVSDPVRRFLPPDARSDGGAYTLMFPDLDDAFRELLRFGPDAEVLDPPELRDRLAAAAREVAALYTS
jgi:predicted DNA-binding transcriptional regulator YafY